MGQEFNQEQIEHFAAAWLIKYFAYNSKTQSEFKLADKSAGYDGMIYFYDIDQGDKRKKDKAECVFYVQYKGTFEKIKERITEKFNIKLDDLKFYEKTNGHCLYFKIALKVVNGKVIETPYYHFFSRFELNRLIEDMSNNNKVNRRVKFTKMGDIKSFQAILQNLKGDLNQCVISKEKLAKMKANPEGINISREIVITDDSSLESLYGEEFILYAKSEFGEKVAVGSVTFEKQLFDENLDFVIEFGDIDTVYPHSASSIDRTMKGIEITKSIKLYIRELTGNKGITISFNYSLNEEETMETLVFSHKIMEYLRTNGEIKINGYAMKINSNVESDTSNFEEFSKGHFQILNAMKHFEMNLDESIKNVTGKQVKELLYMYDIEQGKIINEEVKLVYFEFGVKVYYFLLFENGVRNILAEDFESKMFLKVETNNGLYEYVPNFIMATRDIHKVHNYNFKDVQDRINESVLENNWDEVFNKYELEMITDFDNSRDSRVLSIASLINKLLLEKEPNNIIEKINYWQILARKEGLSFDDIKELKDIVQDSNYTEDVHLAAKLLINTRFKGEFSLEKDSLDSIKEYPIYNLVNNLD
ncbi:TPA: hypothetical protein REB85_002887 [Listeria monocytogenes]|uniref:hypothetical protein n=2 Tax=Listeria monocytogenes TaxID=1639 RepID=UPI00074D51A1|nr:hypothetical protein [Listeria monocytogenes]EAG8540644.1 hypothetical protein [Listeria innocua]EAE6963917.1 hypothetical protein [Listeria monocytogenes]EAG7018577.1 hypothetical protein [Listeria monocytogenes]EAH3990637.1 hypothetical protein [Listeria monocytogenes]EAV9844950.1 hypothetical protein [Listeria monocytogenes]